MISKNETKGIQQLYNKKFRNLERAFVAETPKVVDVFLHAGFKPLRWYATEGYRIDLKGVSDPVIVSDAELKKLSRLETPNRVVAVFGIPEYRTNLDENFILALDGVRDPGNLGTILRLADWFGLSQVLLSEDCVDPWNPKVVQASMGSLARVTPAYVDLKSAVEEYKAKGKLWIADMNGNAVYSAEWPSRCMLVMGNEANGVSKEISSLSDGEISIPHFGGTVSESLNVAMATGILLSEYRRR